MMIEPWNDRSLLQPSVHTFPCDSNAEVYGLSCLCNDIIRVLSNQSPLYKECAIVSRFLYKYDKKFRNDLGYKNFKKVNTALKRYLTINFLKDVENFYSFLPSRDSMDLYLPSKQMLQYVLVRLQSFSKLLLRICACSKQGAVFYLDRVKRGESHWMSLMPYAVLSRIWSLCKVLLQYSTKWYARLFTYLNRLQSKGMQFLPNDYKFPIDLEEWLEVKDFDDFGRFNWTVHKSVVVQSVFSELEDSDEIFDIMKYVENINDEIETVIDNEKIEIIRHNIVELCNQNTSKVEEGEVISRDHFKLMTLQAPQNNVKFDDTKNEQCDTIEITEPLHDIYVITNTKDLEKFIVNEEDYRHNSCEKSLTNHLSFMQWQALKTTLIKLCESNKDIKNLSKIHKIWQKKCLDYNLQSI